MSDESITYAYLLPKRLDITVEAASAYLDAGLPLQADGLVNLIEARAWIAGYEVGKAGGNAGRVGSNRVRVIKGGRA